VSWQCKLTHACKLHVIRSVHYIIVLCNNQPTKCTQLVIYISNYFYIVGNSAT
jgi:hypothetical protein